MAEVERISQMTTSWTLLREAHGDSSEQANLARQLLVERYLPAVRRYLGKILSNQDLLDELTQEFAFEMVRGGFHRADPEKGRFRSYLKTTLFNLVRRYRRGESQRGRLTGESEQLLDQIPAPEQDTSFDEEWRDHLLSRTWDVLVDTNARYHRVLKARTEHPDLDSGQLAKRLSEQSGEEATASGVRQTLRRARRLFAELLVEEVSRSLNEASEERLHDELQVLGLLDQCKEVLNQR